MRFEKSAVMSVLMVMLVGCMPAATVRTADVLAPGGLGGGMTAAVGGWSFGTSTLEEDGETVQVTGNGARSLGSPSTTGGIVSYAYAAAMAWGFRAGVAPGVELGVQYGFGRLGLEARVAALDEDRGAPLSLAPAVMVAREPWHGGDVPLWWRVGADASRRRHLHDREYRTPAVGLWVSGGGVRQLQHMLGKEHGYPITDCREGWPGTPCGTAEPHTKGRVEVERDEVVLSMPVSLSRQSLSEKGGMSLTAGLVPQVALWSSAPRGLSCSGCREGVAARGYTERWQLTLEVSVSGMSTRGMALP